MKIVIDISEDVYTRLFDNGIQDNEIAVDDVCEMARAIRLGTPLPKGHGNLIQREEAETIFRNARMALYKQSRTEQIKDFQTRESMLLNAEQFVHLIKPIIEADKEESEVQENDIPWYLKIFNQDILNEYQKRMRDATPEERQKEVPYNDEGSNIHSEAYKEEQGMVEDRLNKTISDLAYILDSLISLRQIQNIGDCNICKNKDCGYMPKIGQMVRYNCPFYKAESEE